MNNSEPTTKHWLMLVLLVLVWGSSFVFVSIALRSFDPLSVVFSRVLLGGLILLILSTVLGNRLRVTGRLCLHLGLMGLFGQLLPMLLLTTGQLHVSAGMTGLLMAVMPLSTMILAHYFVDNERLNRFKIFGFCIGIAGVAVVLWPSLSAGENKIISALLILVGAISYSVNSIIVRRLPDYQPTSAAAGTLLITALALTPFVLSQELPQHPSTDSIIAIIWLGIGPSALSTFVLYRVIRSVGPSFLSNINYPIPAVAFLTGAWILDEPISAWSVIGLGLILSGIATTRIRVKSSRQSTSQGPIVKT